MQNGVDKSRKKSAVIENGITKNLKELDCFHPKSKIHKEFCPRCGILETVCLRIKIIFECLLVFFVFIWGFFIWFVRLFICTRRKDITGQLALITGGANGFGRELCLRFALEGCDIAIVDLDLENAKLVAKELEQITTVKVKEYKIDVSKPWQIDELRLQIVNDFGRNVDILVNNAGVMPMTSFDDQTEVYENCINVNFMAHIWTIRAFLPSMISNERGHIVAVSSEASFSGGRYGSIYCSSKVAVRSLMESLRDDLNMRNVNGVHTSCVLPYFMATEGLQVDRFKFIVPPICPDRAAKILVENVLRNNICFTIPKSHIWAMSLISIIPEVVKYRVLDYVLSTFLGFNVK